MLINRVSGSYDAYITTARARKAEQNRDEERDSVTTSARAREFQAARDALANLPDVRAEKVSAMKTRLDNGTYHVPTADLATSIMASLSGGDYFA